ncbi:hypothetical protein [Ruminococcus sp.]|uniref:hypothetical protein n=1 Tax=Ruminococcus sp. TaxID=41978 RepID=UPI0025D189D8|nr:hypothetical protein [Ruminococcus sp.]
MAEYTKNLGLKKPDRSDRFSIEDLNGNMDIIDIIPDMASGTTVPVGTAYAWTEGSAVKAVVGVARTAAEGVTVQSVTGDMELEGEEN